MTKHSLKKSAIYSSLIAAMSSAPATTLAAEALALEEIIVTAQKRVENLQLTPISVIAFSGETLEAMNVQNTGQLAEITPNMTIQSDRPGQSYPVIRGIGSPIKGPGIDQGVAMYLDGVQVDSSGANLLSVLDLQQVEVLKGPQGTLYGRNAVGGVINMTSRRPSEEFQGHVSGGVGNYDAWNVGGAIEGSLIEDKLVGRLSATHLENDAYYKNTNPGFDDNGALETDSARMALVFTPTDDFEISFSADYSDQKASGPAFQTVDYSNGAAKAAILGTPSYVVPVYYETDGDNFKLSHNLDTYNDSTIYGAALTLKYVVNDQIDLISITGYRETEQALEEDLDSSPNDYLHVASKTDFDNTTQEFRLHFTNEDLKGVVGLFYSNSNNENMVHVDAFAEFIPVAGAAQPTYSHRINESTAWAAFTQWDWDFTESLTLTLGARWSESEKDIFNESTVFTEINGLAAANGLDRCFILESGLPPEQQPACLTAVVPAAVTSVDVDGDWSRFSPKVGLQYRLNDDVMFYGSYSEGYRDGGYAGTVAEFGEFDPEILDAYEIGVKSDLMDGRVRLNFAAFYYEYEDLQLQISQLKDGQVFTQVFNAGEAEMTGAELDITWLASEMFRLSANVGVMDSEITKLDQAEGRDFGFIKEGNEFPQSPGLQASLVPEFYFSTSMGDIVWRTEINYTGDYYEDSENGAFAGSDAGTLTGVNIVDNGFVFDPSLVVSPDTLVDSENYSSRTLVNTSVIFTNNDDNLELSLWARNLLDEEYQQGRRYVAGVVLRQNRYALPRTYGLNVKYRF